MSSSRKVLRHRRWQVGSENAQHETEQVATKQVAIGAHLLVLNDDAVCSQKVVVASYTQAAHATP